MCGHQRLTQPPNHPSQASKPILLMPNRWFRHKADEFEQFAIDVIMGRREDMPAILFGAFLQVCSYLFSGIVQLRL